MRIGLFCHSLLSDWNHGNAHFLRGVVTELLSRGHDVRVYEPRDAWSVQNLLADHGPEALDRARAAFPWIEPVRYDEGTLDVDRALDGCALALVHEWNGADLIRRLGEHRRRGGRCLLLFHDTHHRIVTRPEEIARFELSAYDGVLAFGASVREKYADLGWGNRAWTWHEAADTAAFAPAAASAWEGHVAWIGNWGDDERTHELDEYLFRPVAKLGLRGTVFGVRYPEEALHKVARAGLTHGGWLANFLVPEKLSTHLFTVHVPRRAYARQLPGVPTIRVFESLACGAPLICAPWEDREGLFTPGRDYLVARDGDHMGRIMRDLVHDGSLRRELAEHGRSTILARHTCGHRVTQLLEIVDGLAPSRPTAEAQT